MLLPRSWTPVGSWSSWNRTGSKLVMPGIFLGLRGTSHSLEKLSKVWGSVPCCCAMLLCHAAYLHSRRAHAAPTLCRPTGSDARRVGRGEALDTEAGARARSSGKSTSLRAGPPRQPGNTSLAPSPSGTGESDADATVRQEPLAQLCTQSCQRRGAGPGHFHCITRRTDSSDP